jgi:hypothetical protein
MPGAWNNEGQPKRPEDEVRETAIGGSGSAPGLASELGGPRAQAGAGGPVEEMAGAKPAMMGVYDQPERRFGGLAPLILLLVVIAALLALSWALFATHSEAPKASSLAPLAEELLRLSA